ncbi:hypothetical protein AB0J20_02260 [Micromonospora costi]|uniref:hypothetical protein n=1 Tax=Micromonospora costi TaxID=1530042 RepID=UPI0033E48731
MLAWRCPVLLAVLAWRCPGLLAVPTRHRPGAMGRACRARHLGVRAARCAGDRHQIADVAVSSAAGRRQIADVAVSGAVGRRYIGEVVPINPAGARTGQQAASIEDVSQPWVSFLQARFLGGLRDRLEFLEVGLSWAVGHRDFKEAESITGRCRP